LPVLGLAVATFLGAGLTWWIYAGKGADEWRRDARYLPDGSHVVVTIKVDEFLNSAAGKAAIEQISRLSQQAQGTFEEVGAKISGKPAPPRPPMLEPREFLTKEVRRELGIDPFDIVHVTVAQAEGDRQGVTVARTRKAVKAEEIQKHLARNAFQFVGPKGAPPAEPRSIKVGAFTVYEAAGVSFVIPEDRVVVYGTTESLRAILERNAAARFSAELTEALANADTSKTIAVAAVLPRGQTPEKVDGLGSAVLPQSVAFSFDVTDQVKITGRGKFQRAEQAGEFKTAVEKVIATARGARDLPPGVGKLLESIQLKHSGDQVHVTANADATAVIALIGQLGTNANQTFTQVGSAVGPAVGKETSGTFKKVGSSIEKKPEQPRPPKD
jgi:hypothetical protein